MEGATGQVQRLLKKTLRRARIDADRDGNQKMVDWFFAAEKRSTRDNIVSLSRHEADVQVQPADLDANPMLLNCTNGTVDLSTGNLRCHQREDLLTKRAPFPYDSNTRCPLWETFLERFFGEDRELIAFVKRAVGYSLTGDVGEQVLFVLWGSGANGMDVDGDGSPDLDPSHIYYFGSSLGGATGTALLSIEPAIHAGVFNVPGSAYRGRRISPPGRGQLGQSLASRIPTLINAPGVTSLDGVVIGAPRFDENFPLRDGVPLHLGLADGTSRDIHSPLINTVAGALAIQEVVDHARWVAHAADPVAYTPHLRKDPLPGMTPKSLLFQFAKGDQTSPNPYNAEIVRAGDLADRATFYRHDLAFAENPALPTNPHTFMPSIDNPAFREISLAAQEQIAVFLASDGTEIIHPEPARFFEVPIVLPLPEALNFIVP